jgi:hypothetical protein
MDRRKFGDGRRQIAAHPEENLEAPDLEPTAADLAEVNRIASVGPARVILLIKCAD